MPLSVLYQTINSVIALTPTCMQMLAGAAVPYRFGKGELIFSSGNAVETVYFINSGIAHQFYLFENGNESVCNFCFAGDFITDLYGFNHKVAAKTSLRALTPVSALGFSCDSLVRMSAASPTIDFFFKKLVEDVAERGIDRAASLLNQSPLQRLQALYAQHPQIIASVPQKLIAAYLGITPESYSRLKRRLVKS